MRFCLVNTFYPPYHFGGDATYVRSLAKILVKAGHEVEIVHCEDAYWTVSKDKESPQINEDENDGIKVHRLKSRFGFLSPLITQQTGLPGLKSRQLKSIFSRDFDVVNFHNVSLIGGPGILYLSKAPINIYTLTEHWLICPTHIFWKYRSKACDGKNCFLCSIRTGIPPQLWRYTKSIKHALRNIDLLLSPSKYTAQRHRNDGIDRPIEIVPQFSYLHPDKITEYIPRGRQNFVFVGRVTASKGIQMILKWFEKLPEYDLLIVGDGDLLDTLQKEYKEVGNVFFLGPKPQDQLIEIYRNAVALVFPSLAPETFGLSVVEAFACGTPAIVSNHGGSKELIENTGGGYLYQHENEFIENVRTLAGNLELRNRLGEAARKGYEMYYTQDKHLEKYLECIEKVSRNKKLRA